MIAHLEFRSQRRGAWRLSGEKSQIRSLSRLNPRPLRRCGSSVAREARHHRVPEGHLPTPGGTPSSTHSFRPRCHRHRPIPASSQAPTEPEFQLSLHLACTTRHRRDCITGHSAESKNVASTDPSSTPSTGGAVRRNSAGYSKTGAPKPKRHSRLGSLPHPPRVASKSTERRKPRNGKAEGRMTAKAGHRHRVVIREKHTRTDELSKRSR